MTAASAMTTCPTARWEGARPDAGSVPLRPAQSREVTQPAQSRDVTQRIVASSSEIEITLWPMAAS